MASVFLTMDILGRSEELLSVLFINTVSMLISNAIEDLIAIGLIDLNKRCNIGLKLTNFKAWDLTRLLSCAKHLLLLVGHNGTKE